MAINIIVKVTAFGVPALLIVLGAILAVTGTLPLGIGMIVGGALIYVAEAFFLR